MVCSGGPRDTLCSHALHGKEFPPEILTSLKVCEESVLSSPWPGVVLNGGLVFVRPVLGKLKKEDCHAVNSRLARLSQKKEKEKEKKAKQQQKSN